MNKISTQPLADQIRPETLNQFIGQSHLVGIGKPLRLMIESGEIRSMLLWGPPGVGKTTIARMLAKSSNRAYYELSAVSAGKKDLEHIVKSVQKMPSTKPHQPDLFGGGATPTGQPHGALLFLDEIHRFNKSQQDYLLPYVEDGTLILIGATTENPSFEVISALLSRTQVFVLHPLTGEEVAAILQQAQAALSVTLTDDAQAFLSTFANGDARKAINLLEISASLYGASLTVDQLKEALQTNAIRYDQHGEQHYDTISAYIKSMRASDPDAALYYLARMIEGGEDPKFIARRLVIFASEDIGMADPHALTLANAVFRAVETVGLPEAGINLGHGTVYMATAPKSRHAYDGYKTALATVRETGNLSIPMHLRNAPTQLMRELGYGQRDEGQKGNLPAGLSGQTFFQPPNAD